MFSYPLKLLLLTSPSIGSFSSSSHFKKRVFSCEARKIRNLKLPNRFFKNKILSRIPVPINYTRARETRIFFLFFPLLLLLLLTKNRNLLSYAVLKIVLLVENIFFLVYLLFATLSGYYFENDSQFFVTCTYTRILVPTCMLHSRDRRIFFFIYLPRIPS